MPHLIAKKVRYAFFDFDGTLIAKDSFVTLLKKGFKQEPWRLVLLFIFIPTFALTILFKLDKAHVKSALLWSLTVGKTKRKALVFIQRLAYENSKDCFFQEAVATLEQIKQQGYEIVLISASGQTWLRAILRNKFKDFRIILGSHLSYCCGGIVFSEKNCYGIEKIKQIHKYLGDNFTWQSSWSDHIADIPILKQAQERFVISPKEKHLKVFKQELGSHFVLLKWK